MSKSQHKPRQKPGPKPKIGAEEQAKVLGVVGTGGSLADAAGIIGVDYKTLYRHRKQNPEFAKGVRKAELSGKMRLVQKVATDKSWQSAAWMLERKYGAEFGRRETVTMKGKLDHRHAERGAANDILNDPVAREAATTLAERMNRQAGVRPGEN